MKSKDELLGDYREMSENNALHKDEVFLAVLIDIEDQARGVCLASEPNYGSKAHRSYLID